MVLTVADFVIGAPCVTHVMVYVDWLAMAGERVPASPVAETLGPLTEQLLTPEAVQVTVDESPALTRVGATEIEACG